MTASLSELADPLVHFISDVRQGRIEIPPEAVLREKLRAELSRFSQVALQSGHQRPHVESAQYALAAAIDEALRFSKWPGKHAWSVSPLAVELFEERTAGVNFFERLAREEKAASPALEIYHLVMALGFKGRFHAQPEEVDRLLARTSARVGSAEGRELSPHGLPVAAGKPSRRDRSLPLMAALVIGGAALLNVIYAVALGVMSSGLVARLGGGS